jgi:hypothetical protein
MSANSKSVKEQNGAPAKPLIVSAPQPLTPLDEALDRHLAEWGGSGGRMFTFNGATGIFHTTDDGIEVPAGTKFIALLHETRKGYIKFNGPGAAPDVRMVRIDENADIDREELGDNDQSQWLVGLSGQIEDPWKPQFACPMARYDSGGELFVYVARGVVAMNAFGNLLGVWRWHPKRKIGLIPVIEIKSGTYPSKRFGGRKPKPILEIISWVTRTGETPPAAAVQQAIEQSKPDFNDSID